ncbi:MAG TPA: cytochrome c [Nitrospirota bacterium]|nr:cytochrome c [Nitrospirota bacterium]
MKKLMLLLSVGALFSFISITLAGEAISKHVGEDLYKKHCSACHPKAARLKSRKNIVAKMRNPMSFMPAFDEKKISNENAKKIDDYIHECFLAELETNTEQTQP